jgi:hypothetical protein
MEAETQKNLFARSPTLNTVLMVEKTIEKYSGELNRTEVWKKLPKKVMWQTFLIVIDYLEQNNKIIFDKNGLIVWIWNPALIRKLTSGKLLEV